MFESTSDTEVIAALLAEHPSHDIRGALRDIIPRLRGAFSAVLLTRDAVIGFRDPYGVRPLVLGQIEGRYCLASESSGLDIIGAKLVREIEPGEICWIDEDGYHIEQVVDRKREALCVFEFIYFARPDSVMKGQTLYAARSRMGEELASESPVDADLVIPVPDTGNSAAIGYAAGSGITYGEALIKNRYIGRTFINPEDRVRKLGIRMKFNPLSSAIRGKRLIVVDDSIVRGNTTRALVRVLFEAGAKEVHLRISSPPIVFPCFYGIDMADQDEFIAFGKSVDEISQELGATSVAYLSLDGLMRATGVGMRTIVSAQPASPETIPARCRRSCGCRSSATRKARVARPRVERALWARGPAGRWNVRLWRRRRTAPRSTFLTTRRPWLTSRCHGGPCGGPSGDESQPSPGSPSPGRARVAGSAGRRGETDLWQAAQSSGRSPDGMCSPTC